MPRLPLSDPKFILDIRKRVVDQLKNSPDEYAVRLSQEVDRLIGSLLIDVNTVLEDNHELSLKLRTAEETLSFVRDSSTTERDRANKAETGLRIVASDLVLERHSAALLRARIEEIGQTQQALADAVEKLRKALDG